MSKRFRTQSAVSKWSIQWIAIPLTLLIVAAGALPTHGFVLDEAHPGTHDRSQPDAAAAEWNSTGDLHAAPNELLSPKSPSDSQFGEGEQSGEGEEEATDGPNWLDAPSPSTPSRHALDRTLDCVRVRSFECSGWRTTRAPPSV